MNRNPVLYCRMADNDSSSSGSMERGEDIELATRGIRMMLNNDWEGAGRLFTEHQETSPVLHFCHSFLTFLQALMSTEEERLAEAQSLLEETQKRCENYKSFGKKKKNLSLSEKLQRKIIIADTLIFQAILSFANQELSGYLKGGWYIRKAWKLYSKRFKLIKDMYDGKHVTLDDEDNDDTPNKPNTDSGLSHEELTRLLGSVSFGYGILHLCLAMLPPKVLKIVEFFGFEGNKDQGLWCLEFTSTSKDYKGPLASFALIWYHTVIRPFFALDGAQVDAGVQDALVIMKRIEDEYEKSALFNWFRGRVLRLQAHIDEALTAYRYALEMCGNVREIQLTCLYEIGYCNMMMLNWKEAANCWNRLREESRWSKSYYAYNTAVCLGAMGDIKGCHQGYKDCLKLQDKKRKDNQIEQFALRRAAKFKDNPPSQEHSILLALEILYLWHALPQCSPENRQKMVDECGRVSEKKLFHLSSLIEGVLHRELGNEETAITCLKEAIARHNGMRDDGHVAAFSMYELADIYSEQIGGYDEAKKYFNQAKEMKDYDFENRLHIRIHAGLKKTREQGTRV